MPRFERDDVVFFGLVTFQRLRKVNSDTLVNTATPDITNLEFVFASGHIVTITKFIGGADAQTLRIVGDGTTTISNNSVIKTNTSANKLLALNKVYTFNYSDTTMVWYENE